MAPAAVRLGDRVKDAISGFKGIVTGRYEYLYGCVRCAVRPEELSKEGTPAESQTFDEGQLEVVKRAAVTASPRSRAPFALGDKVKDDVSGFTGVVTGWFEHIHGLPTCSVQPQELREGKPVQAQTYDVGQLRSVKPAVVEPVQKQTGGPRDNPSAPVR
jgi:hypothetical protein